MITRLQYSTNKWLMLLCLQGFAMAFAHAQFNPTAADGLQLWLRADSGVVMNGNFVSQWTDLSGQGRHATSDFDVIRPTLTPNAINGMPAVTFDGVDDFLQFSEMDDVRTVFWVLRENPGANGIPPRPLLGWSGGLNFLRGDNQQIWNGQYAAPQVFNGTTRLNGSAINGANTLLNTGFNLVSLRTAGNVQASHLTMELNIYGRTWWGEMAELLIYNQPLSDEQIVQVEEYLRSRYVPIYSPIEDVAMAASLCDTTLCIPPTFQHVVWNNSMESQCLDVDQSGIYTVAFEDVLGRSYRDTIQVQFEIDDAEVSDVFCAGSNYVWPIAESSFGLNWDGLDVAMIESDVEGSHTLIVTDTNQCSKIIQLDLTADLFAQLHSIAEQSVYCTGAALQITPSLPPQTEVIWNEVLQQPTLELMSSGVYTVQAMNPLGCILRDTVVVELAGTASGIELNNEGACVGTAVALDATIVSGTDLISGMWDFGDQGSSQVVAVSHTYDAPGSYMLQFTGINESGCTSYASMELLVHALPEVGFDVFGQCVNAPVQLNASANSMDGAITQYEWLIDGNFLQGPSQEVILSMVGLNNIIVSAATEYGCQSEWSELHQMYAAPAAQASVDSVCLGGLTQFSWELISSGTDQNNVTTAWEFGDGTGSLQAQPFHYYPYAGNYMVNVIATNSMLCRDTTYLTAVVFELPEADYLIANFCEGEPQALTDMSIAAEGDPIATWSWTADGNTNYSGSQPILILAGQGLHPVNLMVTTEHGCVSEVMQQIPVWPAPVISFTWNPLIAGAPWNVPFEAATDLNVDFEWHFGDGSSGSGATTEHIFGLNDTYEVQLIGTTPQGCSAVVSQFITVADPIKDLSIQALQVTTTDNGSLIQVQVRNNGNIKLDEIIMSWQLGGDAPVLETWQASLAPGDVAIYEFRSRVTATSAQYPYLCVYGETSPWMGSEVNLTDNAFCKPLQSGGLELFAPFPNPGNDRMFIRLIAPSNGVLVMRVIDIKGQEVLRFDELEVSKGFQQFFIDISSLVNGSYRLMAEMDLSKSVVSFLKIASE
jgi:PKD repeat protein